MAAKPPHPIPPDNTGTYALSQFPPAISPASSLLASVISLPEDPIIAYATFIATPESRSDILANVEAARRNILQRNIGKPILESLLPSICAAKDSTTFYVFALGTVSRTSEFLDRLATLQFNGLNLSETCSFTPSSIYPCSATCSNQLNPCPNCLNTWRSISSGVPQTFSSTCYLPRRPLRQPYLYFLQAVRDRLIDDIAEASKFGSGHINKPCTRLKDGFLLALTAARNEWGFGWEHHVRARPLIHCQLQIHLSQLSATSARLVIHPVLRPTHYIPLLAMLPLPSGTSVTLLPHCVPAYYISTYAGPTSALTAQFDVALAGLGVGNWKVSSVAYRRTQFNSAAEQATDEQSPAPAYIIAWIAVQNMQGEEKGIPIIWPAGLCLSYLPSSPSVHARSPLKYIPELAAQLQASPPPPSASIPASFHSSGSLFGNDGSLILASTSSSQPQQDAYSCQDRLTAPIGRRSNSVSSSPTSDTLRAFRTLSFVTKSHTKDIRHVAAEVSGYVDAVAKDRERERERIRREREGTMAKTGSSGTPASVTAGITPNNSATVKMDTVFGVTSAVSTQGLLEDPMANLRIDTEASNLQLPPSEVDVDLPPTDSIVQLPVDIGVITGRSPVDALTSAPPMIPVESSSFEYSNFDTAWSQPPNDFMDINVDYDVNFHLGIHPMGGHTLGDNGAGNFDIDEGFGVFTDDDFNFFDGPSTNTQITATSLPSTIGRHSIDFSANLTSATGAAPFSFPPAGDRSQIMSSGPPVINVQHTSSWGLLGESFTPRTVEFYHGSDSIPPAPELLPPSPSRTSSSQSAPTTPNVQLADRWESNFQPGLRVFDPIPFASSHRLADGKYVVGKFALLSPPTEDTPPVPYPTPSLATNMEGWRSRYKVATDPRVGVVRKLIGVKRKSFGQGSRGAKTSPWWARDDEEWASSSPPSTEINDSKSDPESDDEDPWVEEDESTQVSRPSTPPPSYLPLGPSLLQTYFHHAHLLPLSRALRPSDAINMSTPAPMSVPTPVSPAAVLGAANEKTKALEAAAQILVKEVVENSTFAEAWRANALASVVKSRPPTKVWQADVKEVGELLMNISGQPPVDIKSIFGPDTSLPAETVVMSLKMLDAPMLSVGKSDSVINVLPPALRFWDKLGLCPRTGRKDACAFVLYEPSGETSADDLVRWLDAVSRIYSVKNYGKHFPGISNGCTTPGLVPIQFESFRKTLLSFVSNLPLSDACLVFYIITPTPIITLGSPSLRQLLSAVRRVLKTHAEAHILFQFVPESLIAGALVNPSSNHSGLETFVESLFDRILRPVDRVMSRRFFEHGNRARAYFQEPAFAIARPLQSKVRFVRDTHAGSLDLFDRHTLLHVGYQVTHGGKWLLAACIDQKGEAHDLGVWLIPSDSYELFVVSEVWSFALKLAKKANVEWRVIISKFGVMRARELEAWINHIATSHDDLPMHISLLAADQDNPWMFLAPNSTQATSRPVTPTRTSKNSHGVFSDIAASTYVLHSSIRFLPPAQGARELLPETPFVPDADDDPVIDDFCALPQATSTLVRVPAGTDYASISMLHLHFLYSFQSPGASTPIDNAETRRDVAKSFHELSVLARVRWKLKANPALPFHLAALEVMQMALDRGEMLLE